MTEGGPLSSLETNDLASREGKLVGAVGASSLARKRRARDALTDGDGEDEGTASRAHTGQADGVFTWPRKISKTSRVIKNTSSATRDHLAVERTYLSWLRLATALSTISGALLIRFHFSTRPVPILEANFSRPMGIIFFVLSLVVLASGTVTFFTTQRGYIKSIGFVEVGKFGSAVAAVTATAVAVTTILLLITEKV